MAVVRKRPLYAPRRDEFLEDHLPYRLIALDGFAWYCERIAGLKIPYDVKVQVASETLGFVPLTNALVDAGLSHGRALCQYLGFQVRRGERILEPANRRPGSKGNDLWPVDLKLRDITPAEACKIGPGTPAATRKALEAFLWTANKGVAHVTLEKKGVDAKRLGSAAVSIRRLADHHIFRPLGVDDILERTIHPLRRAEAEARKPKYKLPPNLAFLDLGDPAKSPH